jgi:EAL domain-containing protein (putative c-di-GMP-specific phosphodiesterase class I)/GGDEF domain-containing protein
VNQSLFLRLILTILSCCISSAGFASLNPITITEHPDIQASFEYYEDVAGQAVLDDMLQVPDLQWQWIENGTTTLGFKSTPYWLRFSVHNQTSQGVDLIAGLNYSQLDNVIFYVFDGHRQSHEFATGDTRPFYPREVDHPAMLLQLHLSPDQLKTVYVRVQTDGSMILPLQIARSHHYFESVAKEHKLHFFYYGALTVIILINFAVFLTLREKLYLYYSLAIAGYLLFFASILGYSFQHFYPAYPEIHSRALLVSMPVLAFFSVLFCREFLQTAAQSPKLDLALKAMMYFEIFNFFSALFFSYNTAIMLSAISAFFFFSILFVAGPIRWAAGMRAGIFFTIAWAPLTIGVLATTARSLGILPVNFWTQYAMQIGSGLEAFILTLALADRLYREREEKIKAQADSLRKEKARHEAHNKLAEAMTHDAVTGLPNRNRFERMVNQRLQSNPEGYFMVGVTRVTRLDEINRTLGLSRSERLLKGIARQMQELAGRLPSIIRVKDDKGSEETVYQLSGDSFGVLIDPRKQMEKLKDVAAALRLLTEPLLIDNLAIELHPKFGAASYPMHGDNAALLIRNAHVGMEITPHGKQEVGFYSPEYDIYSESRLTLMSDLKEALSTQQTELYYQPKACLHSGKIIGLEALIRWHHPERGWVYPSDFIPLAEETGVITQLTRWAIEQGISDLAELDQDYPGLSISINISARDLSAGELNAMIEEILKRHSVRPEQLILELTETAAMEDPEQGLQVLKKLTDLGLSVSIDDFGSGYSSLSYLKKLPATEIKLDRSLVMDVCSDESSKVIVETAINMVHGLGYLLVAEGVETEATARLLQAMGCDRLQGYWLCHPLPLDKLKQWMREQQGKSIL